VLIACTAALVGSPFAPAARGDGAPFAGYAGRSTASAVTWMFNIPGALPSNPTGELHFAYSHSFLEPGPSAYGLASEAWPGSTAASAPSFATQEAHRQGLPPEFPDAPQYPIRAETFYPQGPDSQRSDLGGGSMESKALADRSFARSALNSTVLPGSVDARTVASAAESVLEDGSIVSRASASVEGVSILSGILQVDAVRTFAEARSNAETATVTGGVTGALVRFRTSLYYIDEKGFHGPKIAGQEIAYDVGPVNEAIAENLGQYGITMSLAGPIDVVEGARASRTIGGLVINFAAGALRPYVDLLPEPVRTEFRNNISVNQTVTVVIGGVGVTAAANPLHVFELPPPPIPPIIQPPSTEVLGETFTRPPLPTAPPPAGGTVAPPPVVAVGAPIDAEAVSPWLAFLVLAFALIGGSLLRRIAVSATSGTTTATDCTLGS